MDVKYACAQAHVPSGGFCGTTWLQPKTCVFRPISGASASFQGLTERSSPGARGEFLPPLESAFFDTFFHASAERKYEEIGVWAGSTATRRRVD